MRSALLIIVPFLILAFAPSDSFAAKRSSTITQPQKSVRVAKKKKAKKRVKYVAPSREEIKVESFPLSLPISDEVLKAIAANDIDEAARVIRTDPPSSRSLNLLREMQQITEYNKKKDVPKLDRHKFYQNLGIAYHNLFLLLKRNDMNNEELFKNALKFYNKTLRTRSPSEKSEAELLTASLLAANGETEKAKNTFEKVDLEIIQDNYRSFEYLAVYYSALGETGNAVENLRKAHEMNPEGVELWVAIGDDFYKIESSEEFTSLIDSWKKKEPPKEKAPTSPKKKKRK